LTQLGKRSMFLCARRARILALLPKPHQFGDASD
jgi:hypothetical protein